MSDRITNAIRIPHKDLRHSPMAAKAQPAPTTNISQVAAFPRDSNVIRAFGLSVQRESNGLPGKISNTIVRVHIAVPNAKNPASNLIMGLDYLNESARGSQKSPRNRWDNFRALITDLTRPKISDREN